MSTTRRGRRVLSAAVAGVAVAGGVAWAAMTDGGEVLATERCLARVDGVTRDLAPDQAANAALIAAVSVRRGLPARAATIAIATAVQESKLRNLDYGDRDSLGLFQQRPSQGWGTAAQVTDPIYATNAFYDALVTVDGYEEMEITVASDRVQRSAFPEAVAGHEPEGRAFASALTGYSPAALTCRLQASDGAGNVEDVLTTLEHQLGGVDAATDDTAPAVLRLPVGDGDGGRRRAWVLAHWAVANADALHVVRVTADGREWTRASGNAWGEAPDAPSAEVVVEVASP